MNESAQVEQVRVLLDSAARPADGSMPFTGEEVGSHWQAGRRRRTRRRAGTGVVAGLAAASLVVIAWQSGLMGGATDLPEQTVAAIPDGYTTFVFAAPDAPETDVSANSAITIPQPAELAGTQWLMTDELWGPVEDLSAGQVIASDTSDTSDSTQGDIVLSFGTEAVTGWGIEIENCGTRWVQQDFSLNAQGRFPPADVGAQEFGCAADAARAQEFWTAALTGGGYLRMLGDDQWLLLSVIAPSSPGLDEPVTTPDSTLPAPTGGTETEEPSTQEPSIQEPSTQDPGTQGPTHEPEETPSQQPPSSSEPETSATDPASPLPGFSSPDEVLTSPDWPGSGGDLFATQLRTGVNDGFDRIVVDLTGTSAPTWRAAYISQPRYDGSGLPVQIAGDSTLEVIITGMAYPEEGNPIYDDGDAWLDSHQLEGIDEVMRTTPFEGQILLFAGVNGEPRPYRILLLSDPMRLVVDIQHAD